jgi:hypothetical protein
MKLNCLDANLLVWVEDPIIISDNNIINWLSEMIKDIVH